MPASWLGSPFADAGAILAATLVVLVVARRLIIAAASGPDPDARPPRRPGAGALPRSRICPAGDCAAPNRLDALYCRRCGTKLPAGPRGG
jgi:hypothetical protein